MSSTLLQLTIVQTLSSDDHLADILIFTHIERIFSAKNNSNSSHSKANRIQFYGFEHTIRIDWNLKQDKKQSFFHSNIQLLVLFFHFAYHTDYLLFCGRLVFSISLLSHFEMWVYIISIRQSRIPAKPKTIRGKNII